jgi:hypothetical protein
MTDAEALLEQPTPVQTLVSIGFTRNEANAFLNRVENSFVTKSTKIVRYRQQKRSFLDYKTLLTVVWGYALMVWLYVIAMQLRFPDSVYWPLAVWLPIRIDYLGEIAFIFSFLLACGICISRTRFAHADPLAKSNHRTTIDQ